MEASDGQYDHRAGPNSHCPLHQGSAVWTPPAARAAASASTRPSTRAGASATLPERRQTGSEQSRGRGRIVGAGLRGPTSAMRRACKPA